MEESTILSEFDRLVEAGQAVYDHKQHIIEHVDGGLKFRFLLTSALFRKPTLHSPRTETDGDDVIRQSRRLGSDISTKEYEIGDITNSHFLIINKFCFARPHLLMLTSDGYRRQYEPLFKDDLQAAWSALFAMRTDYVVFYNCGQDGGCSRLHKHMQLIPMPENTFADFLESEGDKEPNVPFRWFFHRFRSQQVTPALLVDAYTELLKQASKVGDGRSQHSDSAPPEAACPHNVIFTKRWMIVLPRRQAGINKEAAANALGMLGYIAVSTQQEINNWVRLGPTQVLRELGVPREI